MGVWVQNHGFCFRAFGILLGSDLGGSRKWNPILVKGTGWVVLHIRAPFQVPNILRHPYEKDPRRDPN